MALNNSEAVILLLDDSGAFSVHFSLIFIFMGAHDSGFLYWQGRNSVYETVVRWTEDGGRLNTDFCYPTMRPSSILHLWCDWCCSWSTAPNSGLEYPFQFSLPLSTLNKKSHDLFVMVYRSPCYITNVLLVSICDHDWCLLGLTEAMCAFLKFNYRHDPQPCWYGWNSIHCNHISTRDCESHW